MGDCRLTALGRPSPYGFERQLSRSKREAGCMDRLPLRVDEPGRGEGTVTVRRWIKIGSASRVGVERQTSYKWML